MTKKLYENGEYIKEFSAVCLSVEKTGEGYTVVTDRTGFFPEGGGQTSDTGTLGSLEVFYVSEKDGTIYHHCRAGVPPVPGETVEGKIDFLSGYDKRQQHTGEHIVSGTACRLFGCSNIGFHLGEDTVTADLDILMSPEQIKLLQEEANRVVTRDLPVEILFPTEEEAKTLPYRSKKEVSGRLRLVKIGDADLCACCAPHLKRTGEVGIILITAHEKSHGGTRLYISCGDRAYKKLTAVIEQNKLISVLLSVKEENTAAAVKQLKEKSEDLAYRIRGMELDRVTAEAKSRSPADIQTGFLDTADRDLMVRYADLLAEKSALFSAVFGGEDGDYSFFFVTKTGFDLKGALGKLKERLDIKGGGRDGSLSGKVRAKKEDITEALDCCRAAAGLKA